VLDAWDAWRTPLPALGFGVAVVGLLGIADPRTALAFTAVRAVALLLAPTAPSTVAPFQPVTTSEMSFTRLVRLQHVARDTRAALTARYPRLPARADVRFQALPRMAEVGLQGPLALRVWYADSTLAWRPFGGLAGFDPNLRYAIAYDTHRRWRPVVLDPLAVSLLGRGIAAMAGQRLGAADSLLAAAQRAQTVRSDELDGAICANRARLAYARADYATADSLNHAFADRVGTVAEFFGLQAASELARGQADLAQRDVASCFALDPANAIGRQVAAALARARPGGK
jgi:hypothetical protein